MIQIFLSGKQVFPKDKSSIKITAENPFFTKQAQYTYDIELPVRIPQNYAFFGDISRLDINKRQYTYDARMFVDNMLVIAGTAHITQVTESAVKIQILGASSAFNYLNKLDTVYIDELDLGTWSSTLGKGDDSDETVASIFKSPYQWAKTTYDAESKGKDPFKAVSYPVYNSNADAVLNDVVWSYGPNNTTPPGTVLLTGNAMNAVQPYVWVMVEKIAAAMGFTLAREDNDIYGNDFFCRIFIANCNNYNACNRCLPHWTVSEWWQQIEYTFGVVVSFNYADKTMKLKNRTSHYSKIADTFVVEKAADSYNVEMDAESESDITATNVCFADYDSSPADILSEYIISHARWLDAGMSAGNYKEDVIYFDSYSQYCFFKHKNSLRRVNNFRERKIGSSDNSIELKFVPCPYVPHEIRLYKHDDDEFSGDYEIPDHIGILKAEGADNLEWFTDENADRISIDDIINYDGEEKIANEDKPDVIYIAVARDSNVFKNWWPGGPEPKLSSYPYPITGGYDRDEPDDWFQGSTGGMELSLVDRGNSIINFYSETVRNKFAVDTRQKYCISFISNSIPGAEDIFIIRNKRYVCAKLEISVNSESFDKLITGYFYRLDS